MMPPLSLVEQGWRVPGQLRPRTASAVVQLPLIADLAAARVTVPPQTALFSFISTPSLVDAFGEPYCGSGHTGRHAIR